MVSNRDRSDESVWGCSQVGRDCRGHVTEANEEDDDGLWPCRGAEGDDSAQCIAATKVSPVK